LGFDPNDLPTESAFRMALGNTEEEWLVQCADSLAQSLMACCTLLITSAALRG